MRARQKTLPHSASGMKVRSAGVILTGDVQQARFWKYLQHRWDAEELAGSPGERAGRGKAISGSRPTMMVSVWWRAWLQRQTVGSRITMKQAIW